MIPDNAVEFKVASVSENTNSFGLFGMMLMNREGDVWEVAANSLHIKPKGTILRVQRESGTRFPEFKWWLLGFEIPCWIGRAPQNVIKEIWNANAHD